MAESSIRSLNSRIRDGVIIAVLIVLLFIVLLPLFWMILTAFKVKGTAFQLEFLPQTEIYLPEEGQQPFALPVVQSGEWYLHAETEAPEATTVALLVQDPTADAGMTFPMNRFSGGIWSATVGPLEAESIDYRFIINGEEQEVSERLSKQAGLSVTSEAAALVYRDAEGLTARVRGNPESDYALLLDNEMIVDLVPQDQPRDEHLIYTANFRTDNIQTAEAFRLVETRSLGTAIAEKYTFVNFLAIINNDDFPFLLYFFNSLIVATGAGILTVFICTLAGYAFAVKEFHFREQLFGLLLLSMLVPGMIYMVPQFSITLNLGLMNTYAGMIVPHLANVFGLFLLRQYIGQIPRDLFAAAEVDGAREHQVFTNVVIPICLPIMVTLFLLTFVMQWSNFLWQLIINTGTSDVLTLPVGLQQFKGQNANDWEKIMAGACFSIVPIAVLFMSMQKYFLEGLTAGSVKE